MTEKLRLVKNDLDKEVAELVLKMDHEILMVWACDCAERVLPFFEEKYPKDKRPRLAIEAGRRWADTGVFRMADIRKASLDAHSAARDVSEDDSARSAARAAGQAVATAHVSTHSIAAAVYAATAVRDGSDEENSDTAVTREREWQFQHLKELGKKI